MKEMKKGSDMDLCWWYEREELVGLGYFLSMDIMSRHSSINCAAPSTHKTLGNIYIYITHPLFPFCVRFQPKTRYEKCCSMVS